MNFPTNPNKHFDSVIDRSQDQVEDALVKSQYVAKGQDMIFDCVINEEGVNNFLHVGKILKSTRGRSYLSANAWRKATYPHVIYITGTRGSRKSDGCIISPVNVAFSCPLSFQRAINAVSTRISAKSVEDMKFSGINLTDSGDMIRMSNPGWLFLGDQISSRTVFAQVCPRITTHDGYSSF